MTAEYETEAFNRGLDEYLEDQRNAAIGDDPKDPHCVVCGNSPRDIGEYTSLAIGEEIVDANGDPDPVRACITEEGTYNRSNGHFWCTADYIRVGQPLGVAP